MDDGAASLAAVRLVSFDVGGTLLAPWPSVGDIYSEVMARHGLVRAPVAVDQAFGRAWKASRHVPRPVIDAAAERQWWHALVTAVVRDLDHGGPVDPLFDELWVEFMEPSRWRLHAGALETLTALRHRGYRLVVLSNWDERLRPLLQRMGLSDFFETLVISAEVGIEKPDVRIFRLVEERCAVAATAILHVGDSEHHDAGGCRAAGWQWRLVTHRDAGPATGSEPGRVARLDDLLALLPGPGPDGSP